MSIGLAFYGGIYNFFSIWILCLLQVLPFLLACAVGVSLLEMNSLYRDRKFLGSLPSLFLTLLGFGFIYAALEASPTRLAAFLFHYQAILLQIGGVFLFLASFYLLGVLKLPSSMERPVRMGGTFLAGSILGLAYQPCITPILSGVVNLIKDPDYFSKGFVYLLSYTLGLTFSMGIAGGMLIFLFSIEKLSGLRPYAIKFCGLLLLAISAIILLQKMTVYKSFLVGM